MSVLCVFGLHKWTGCKCSACGTKRDQQHDWKSDCEKCHTCGAARHDAHEWSGCKCSACGTKRDEQHHWKSDCEKCRTCGATRRDAHQWTGCKCSACGTKRDQQHDWKSDCEKCRTCGAARQDAHQWRGCKCQSCGKARDEAHDWEANCEKCSKCGIARRSFHLWNGNSCSKCGRNRIGSIGPGGGVVFHLFESERRGLEAKEAEQVLESSWGNVPGHIRSFNAGQDQAWRLPSMEELRWLYDQKSLIGGFDRDYFHWSSEDGVAGISVGRVLCLVDKTGGTYALRQRGDTAFLRAIREFELE